MHLNLKRLLHRKILFFVIEINRTYQTQNLSTLILATLSRIESLLKYNEEKEEEEKINK